MKYIIDGRFLYGQVLGVQRYAREITQKLDGMVKDKPYDVEIAVPEIDSEGTSAEINSYKTKYDNIKIVILKGRAGRKWEQLTEYEGLKSYHILSFAAKLLLVDGRCAGVYILCHNEQDFFMHRETFFDNILAELQVGLNNAFLYSQFENFAKRDGLTDIITPQTSCLHPTS